MTHTHQIEVAGRTMKVESGKIGMLSDSAILMSYGDTVILTNANASDQPREWNRLLPIKC